MKRLDLLVNERELELLLKRLEQVGVPGYSVNRHVTGRGGSGTVVLEAMEFSGLGPMPMRSSSAIRRCWSLWRLS